MRVFVLCTGRSGSLTFTKACKFLDNYSSGHETKSKIVGPKRIEFPDNHIEVDNHLSWQLGRLEERYGDTPFFVHLTRDNEKVAQSFFRLINSPVSNVAAYQKGVLMIPRAPKEIQLEICRDYVATVESNIRAFLRTKSKVMKIDITNATSDFTKFVEWIGATGDVQAAISEFQIRHNTKNDAAYLSPGHALRHVLRKVGLFPN